MEKTTNEDEMIAEAQRGDVAAQEAIYCKYFEMIWNKANYILKNREDAFDVAQEVFFRVLVKNKINSFRAEAALLTWLIRIARNLCFTRLKQKKRLAENHRPVDTILESEYLRPAKQETPEELLIRQELCDWLHGIIGQLPKKYAQSLLYSIQDFTYAQAAREANISINNYGVLKYRGVEKLVESIKRKMKTGNPEMLEIFGQARLNNLCWDAV